VLKKRSQFAKEVFSWASERPPDVSAPLDCTANPTTGRLEAFVTPNYDGVLNRCACVLLTGCILGTWGMLYRPRSYPWHLFLMQTLPLSCRHWVAPT
jgi:hypothetical protein